jgi:hypothetical protein
MQKFRIVDHGEEGSGRGRGSVRWLIIRGAEAATQERLDYHLGSVEERRKVDDDRGEERRGSWTLDPSLA